MLTEKRDHLFQKGVCPNPNGRPKGAYNEIKKRFIEIQADGSKDAKTIYMELRERMLAGEAWAYQIYFKEIYCLPKRYKEDTAKILPLSLDKSSNIDERIKVYIEALDQFEDYTYEDIMLAIKTLNSIKANEVAANQNSNIIETREELGEKIKAIQEIINYAKKQENGKE